MITTTEIQGINVYENKVPIKDTLPPSLDNLDFVVIYKKEPCCSLFTNFVYEKRQCCYVPCLKYPLDCYIGPEKVGSVYHGFTCCICGLPAYFANDSKGNTEYVIENNVCCTCCSDCCIEECCCKTTYVDSYKIHDKSINNPITGEYHVNYDVWNLICCRIECHPYFDVKFSPTTTKELKFTMLGLCLNF